MTVELHEESRERPAPVPVDVLRLALGAALGAFEMVLTYHGRADLDYFDRLEQLDMALQDMDARLDELYGGQKVH